MPSWRGLPPAAPGSALDPALAAEHLRTHVEASGGTVVHARRPCPPAARHQEPDRDRRHARRAPPRRRGGGEDAGLARPPGARHARRDHRGRRSSRSSARATGEETQMPLRDISFDTISGAGPNGAIMHYRVSHAHQPQARRRRAVPDRFRRRSTRTAPPTSPAPSPSARRPKRCASTTRSCSRA